MQRSRQRTKQRLPPLCLVLLLALLSGGCGNTAPQSWPGPDSEASGPDLRQPLPETSPVAPAKPDSELATPADQTVAEDTRRKASQTASYALLEESRKAESGGNRAAAIAYIERALRLTPRSAVLWIELGRLQLPGAPLAAQRYARKALALSALDTAPYRQAWLLIADAKEQDGDPASAEAIRDRFRTGTG